MLQTTTRFFCVLLFLVSLSALLFYAVGCTPFYEFVGLSPTQVTEQAGQDANAVVHLVEVVRETVWPIAEMAIAGLATLISGWLGLALKKEKAISRAVITGIEISGSDDAKRAVFLSSQASGNAKDVRSRVSDLTDKIKGESVGFTSTDKDKPDG